MEYVQKCDIFGSLLLPTNRDKTVYVSKIATVILVIVVILSAISGLYMLVSPLELENSKNSGSTARNLALGSPLNFNSGNPVSISSLTTETQLTTIKSQVYQYWSQDPMPIGPEFNPFLDINLAFKYLGGLIADPAQIYLTSRIYNLTAPDRSDYLSDVPLANCSEGGFDSGLAPEVAAKEIEGYF